MTEQQAASSGPQWVPFGSQVHWDHARRDVHERITATEGRRPVAEGRRPVAEADHHVFEWTPWGWLRWDAREPGRQGPQQVGVMPPQPSRRARAARWAIARTTLRLGDATLGRVVATMAAGFLGLCTSTALGVPHYYPLIVAVVAGAAAYWAPGGAEYADLYVRRVEDQQHSDELRRMIALHVQLTATAEKSGHREIEQAAQLGHQLLWDAASAVTAEPQPAQLSKQLTTYETEFAQLVQQAADAARSGNELDQAVKPEVPRPPEQDSRAELPPLDALREAAASLGQLSEAQRYARDQLQHDDDTDGPGTA